MKKLLLNLKFAKFEVTLQTETELCHTAFFDIFVSQLMAWGTGGSAQMRPLVNWTQSFG